jgi:hypothetical protein
MVDSPQNAPRSSSDGMNVRHEVDQVVRGDIVDICEAISRETRRLPRSGDRNEHVESRTNAIVDVFRTTRDRCRAAGMFRYLMEGRNASYRAEVGPFIEFLEQNGYANGTDTALFDLGAGPGDLIAEWKNSGRPARGVDLSPSFVLHNPDLRLGLIDGDYDMLVDALDGDFRPGVITTSMTLDRVRNPKQLLANVVNLARQHDASFIVSTILPINPVDDDNSAQYRITYTDSDHLLTRGASVDEDEDTILQEMKKLAGDYDIEVRTLPYTIHSSGETHQYTQHCFCGKKKAKA